MKILLWSLFSYYLSRFCHYSHLRVAATQRKFHCFWRIQHHFLRPFYIAELMNSGKFLAKLVFNTFQVKAITLHVVLLTLKMLPKKHTLLCQPSDYVPIQFAKDCVLASLISITRKYDKLKAN